MLSRVRLCDPMDCSPPGSSVRGFSRQEQSGVAISFSRGSSQPRHRTLVSSVTKRSGKHFTRHLDLSKVGQGSGKTRLEGNVLEEIGDPLLPSLQARAVLLWTPNPAWPGGGEQKQGTRGRGLASPPAREGVLPEGLPWTPTLLLLDGICCGQ